MTSRYETQQCNWGEKACRTNFRHKHAAHLKLRDTFGNGIFWVPCKNRAEIPSSGGVIRACSSSLRHCYLCNKYSDCNQLNTDKLTTSWEVTLIKRLIHQNLCVSWYKRGAGDLKFWICLRWFHMSGSRNLTQFKWNMMKSNYKTQLKPRFQWSYYTNQWQNRDKFDVTNS